MNTDYNKNDETNNASSNTNLNTSLKSLIDKHRTDSHVLHDVTKASNSNNPTKETNKEIVRSSESDIKNNASKTKQRRSLSQIQGEITTVGDKKDASYLKSAWLAASNSVLNQEPELYTHGFHTYPARLSPLLCRSLLNIYAQNDDVFLDPFCGAGTSVLEAWLFGCPSMGSDINPVAIRIAKARSALWNEEKIDDFLKEIEVISEDTFYDARHKISRRISMLAQSQMDWYSPHVMQELQGLFDRINYVRNNEFREMALMIFSSILVKVSKQASDTKLDLINKQVGRGSTSKLFGRKAMEHARRLGVLFEKAYKSPHLPGFRLADAREIPLNRRSVDLIITSPPYAGTYDYHSHQVRRWDWLNENFEWCRDHEIGSKSSTGRESDWIDDELDVFVELHRVLKPGGNLFLITGDGVYKKRPYLIDEEIQRIASESKFDVVAIASQERGIFEPSLKDIYNKTKKEHLIHLRKRHLS